MANPNNNQEPTQRDRSLFPHDVPDEEASDLLATLGPLRPEVSDGHDC